MTLDLSDHCIETEIRKLYNRAISAYFKKDADKDHIEQTIEMARYALEHFDFAELRRRYPPLAGGTDLTVSLTMDNSDYTITMGDRHVLPIIKQQEGY